MILEVWLSDWLILTAYQPVWGYFMKTGYGIAYIIHLCLHFLCPGD